MNITLPRFRKVHLGRGVRNSWRKHRWVRVVGYGVLALGFYKAGHSSGTLESDPRNTNTGPGATVQIEVLHGEWDGVGTLPDGTPFCLVGWPCEDLPDGPQSWVDEDK